MISEVVFSNEYTSTWRLIAPATDLFVRKVNLHLYERQFSVLSSDVRANRRGFINEIAFQIFCEFLNNTLLSKNEILDKATLLAQQKLSKLKSAIPNNLEYPVKAEIDDCDLQVERLKSFFGRISKGNRIFSSPAFPGAGIVNSCEGDVHLNDTLYEIKAGQRNFRALEIKQLLTYAALNKLAESRPIRRLGVFNPRMGISFELSIEDVCLEVSGCTSSELLSEIARVISSGDLSR